MGLLFFFDCCLSILRNLTKKIWLEIFPFFSYFFCVLQYRGVVRSFDACSVLLVLQCSKRMKSKLKCDHSVFVVKLKPNAKSELRRQTGRAQFWFIFVTFPAAELCSAPVGCQFPCAAQGNVGLSIPCCKAHCTWREIVPFLFLCPLILFSIHASSRKACG